MRLYHQGRDTMTLRDAARALDVSTPTFRKWVKLGYVTMVKVGPAESKIRRVPVSEVQRLKREA